MCIRDSIYYASPKLVALKRQKQLGLYNDLFREELYMMEERPAGNAEHMDNFGNSKKIISYLDLLDIRTESNEALIDQPWTVRTRIFDLFIHDWDRHDDQFRWAQFEVDGDEVYRPIPRDRDQAFYKFNGLIPKFLNRQFLKNFIDFGDDLKRGDNFTLNSAFFDRYFLNELEWKEWENEISFLQKNLTDEVIENAAINYQ